MKQWGDYEIKLRESGYNLICGVDEAGRGPLAGDVYAAAVILPVNCNIEGLDDSKKLTSKKRSVILEQIKECALAYSVGVATVEEIDEINILQATFIAMQRAVKGLSVTPNYILVDGNRMPEFNIDAKWIIQGDSLSMSIAAASIIAKETRDAYIIELAKSYPQYELEKHKGYGTKRHIELLQKFGASPIHRKSFIKNFI